MPAKTDTVTHVLFDNYKFKVIRDLESIDHLCFNPTGRIGLIRM